jgi:hypothetical protein
MPFRSPDRRTVRSRFTRVRARGAAARLTVVLLATAVALLAGATVHDGARGQATAASVAKPVARVPALGRTWFALGANLPWIRRGCDFGCTRGGGVSGSVAQVDPILRAMSRRGVRVVRWELFPADAWQVRRDATGMPTAVAAGVTRDLDAAVRLARKHDLYLLPVLLPDPDRVPPTWFTDPAQAAQLAALVRPVMARYKDEQHVLGWELATGSERLADSGAASIDAVRDQARRLVAALRLVAPKRLAVLAPGDVSRIDSFTGLGASLYAPHDPAGAIGDACAHCRDARDVATAEGADAPIAIGAFDVATNAAGATQLAAYAARGYTGALAWSWRGSRYPAHPERTVRFPSVATWRMLYATANAGPRSRPLNPCYGPAVRRYLCPNLRMSVPFNFHLGRRGSRRILYSANSVNSRGDGPASLSGVRNGRYTMAAKQVIHLRNGRTELIPTGAKLLFKAIPGQYRYWKWNGAARMELWRLDSTGAPVERVRVGPKTVYCLRDLKHTAAGLARSPRGMVFPGCSQRLSQQRVTLGTSVGWSDVYPSTYHENWIDVTGLRGCFAYVHIADPTNVIYESNEDDNTSRAVVRLPFTGSNRGCPGAKPLPTIGETGTY